MSNKNTVETMAQAIVSALNEYNKLNIEPKLETSIVSSAEPLTQKPNDIWFEIVDGNR